MTGNNTLVLNQATMIEAVQYWLSNKVMTVEPPKVLSVKTKSNFDEDFEVQITSQV